ncbi:hypothetical protein [Cupriavidus sp. TMH.W2]|uniref:hypothetical protein n=1 Tax=Cupriavidus sp. TMH.W2 TaxID=3434465 RepID=UPI003D771549
MAEFTREQFRALVRWKGYTYRELAERWGVSPDYIGELARKAGRAAHWDDALRGLPNKRTMTRDARLLARRLAALVEARQHAAALRALARKQGGEYRYHGHCVVGDIYTVEKTLGEVADEGERGIVFQVKDTGKGERYGIVFERGLWDWFEPKYLDNDLAATGLSDPATATKPPKDEVELAKRIAAGQLNYWPAVSTRGA